MNQNRKNHPFLRRALTAVLTLLMLVNVCFPAMQARATEETLENYAEFDKAITDAKAAANALDPQSETYQQDAQAVSETLRDLTAKVDAIVTTEAGGTSNITDDNVVTLKAMLSDAAAIVDAKSAENAAFLAKQSQPPVTPAPSDNTSNVGDMDLDDEDDVIPLDPSENETPVLSEAAQAYTDRYNALVAEVDALQIDDPEFETKFNDVYSRIATLNNEVSDAATAGTITVEEYGVLGNNLVQLGETLGKKKDENLSYDANTTAVPVNMGDYNANNYVAYDVARTDPDWWPDEGYNDTEKTYVSKVTLGGVEVNQANSNLSGYGDKDWGGRNRVGRELSNYYKGIDKGSADTNATLTITPSTGYYVSRIVVACCDGGTPYYCGTWKQGLEFNVSFNVSAGGDLSIQLPSRAFGHGTNSSDDESPKGEEQYFILIEVAPVPTPLYVEYLPGIATSFDEKLFNDSDAWTLNSSSNNYDVGSMEQPNTRFKYAYTDKANVSKWEHYANTIKDEAIIAAAENGYYFAGWKAVYYEKCDDNYTFGTVYSSPQELIPQGTQVRLITHVQLTAQWAPIDLNVTKTVSGLAETDSISRSYTFKLQKLIDNVWSDVETDKTVSATGNAVSTVAQDYTYSPAVPGIYRVVETWADGADTSTTSSGTKYYLTNTVDGEDGNNVEISANSIKAGTHSYTLNITNQYSAATPAIKLTKVWQDASGNTVTPDVTFPAVTFTITNANAEEGVTPDQVILNSENSWTGYYYLPAGVNMSDLTVTEASVEGYEQVSLVTGEPETAVVDGVNYIYTVYTATNKQSTTDITIEKKVKGNMGDWSKEFDFTLTYGQVKETFKLSHEGTKTFTVPIGSSVTVSETPDGYTATGHVSNLLDADGKDIGDFNGATTTFTVGANGHTVTFTNEKDAVIETGISENMIPFILLLSTAIVFAMILLLDKARYGKKF